MSVVMPSRRATSAIACPSAGAPVPADVLDQTEQRENLAEAIVDFWKDADVRDPALALVRSIDLDDGLLLGRELEGAVAVDAAEIADGQSRARPLTRASTMALWLS
ncbi:hypothetical protein ABZW44_14240 [Streptomyces mirabilis]|uniref:hypothetical protein n=1 Tax=Streptomyces mirabilis TaxID=68239 RepID=UPI00339DBD36